MPLNPFDRDWSFEYFEKYRESWRPRSEQWYSPRTESTGRSEPPREAVFSLPISLKRKVEALRALAERPGTEAEGVAARAAIDCVLRFRGSRYATNGRK